MIRERLARELIKSPVDRFGQLLIIVIYKKALNPKNVDYRSLFNNQIRYGCMTIRDYQRAAKRRVVINIIKNFAVTANKPDRHIPVKHDICSRLKERLNLNECLGWNNNYDNTYHCGTVIGL